MFIRYPVDFKDYKILDLDTFNTLISCDVHFHEHIFPFHSFAGHQSSFSNEFTSVGLPNIIFNYDIHELPSSNIALTNI